MPTTPADNLEAVDEVPALTVATTTITVSSPPGDV